MLLPSYLDLSTRRLRWSLPDVPQQSSVDECGWVFTFLFSMSFCFIRSVFMSLACLLYLSCKMLCFLIHGSFSDGTSALQSLSALRAASCKLERCPYACTARLSTYRRLGVGAVVGTMGWYSSSMLQTTANVTARSNSADANSVFSSLVSCDQLRSAEMMHSAFVAYFDTKASRYIVEKCIDPLSCFALWYSSAFMFAASLAITGKILANSDSGWSFCSSNNLFLLSIVRHFRFASAIVNALWRKLTKRKTPWSSQASCLSSLWLDDSAPWSRVTSNELTEIVHRTSGVPRSLSPSPA